MPMMPMDPAKAVRVVRPFLVNWFLRDSPNEVAMDMVGLRIFLPRLASTSAWSWARLASSSAGERGVGVVGDHAVQHPDDPGGIFLGRAGYGSP